MPYVMDMLREPAALDRCYLRKTWDSAKRKEYSLPDVLAELNRRFQETQKQAVCCSDLLWAETTGGTWLELLVKHPPTSAPKFLIELKQTQTCGWTMHIYHISPAVR
jgi:hypothetical protein